MASTWWIVVVGLTLAFAVRAFAQAADSMPRTPWGDPDLQGMWPGGSVVMVPFERAEELGTRTELTAEEHAALEQRIAALTERLATTGTGYSPAVFGEIGRPPRQASLVVDPENGRLPPMTADGERRAAEWKAKAAPTYPHVSVEDFRPYDRCISRGVLGSAFPNIYASVMWILQTPGFVIINHEMVHETRVIPLDGRPHIAETIQQWMGDSRGRWEGDTLVVETTNFNGRTGSYGRNGDGNPTSEALRLVERIRRLDDQTLSYEVRVEDAETWTRPWTVAFSLPRDDDYVIYEYACHEGNYALVNILRTVRAAERGAGP
jgi:hypothetical protein